MAVQKRNRTMLGYNDTNSSGRGGGGVSSSTGGRGGGGLSSSTGSTGKPKSSVTITKPVTKNNNSTKIKNELGLLTNTRIVKDQPNEKTIIDKLIGGNDTKDTLDVIDVSSQAIDLVINVVSDVYVNTPDIREITYPKEVRGADFVGYDVDFDISWNSVHATIIRMYVGNSTDYVELGPKGNLTLNVKELLDKYPLQSQTKPASKSFQRSGGLPPNVSMGKAPDTLDARIDGRPDQRDRREEKRGNDQRREQKDNRQREERRQSPPPLPSINREQRNANNNYGDKVNFPL